MTVKDIGKIVKDDYKNIVLLVEEKKIPADMGESIKKANGLRIAITPHYNGIEAEKIQISIKLIIELSHVFIEIVEGILDSS